MVVSTYQAASGAGQSAMLEMIQQAKEVLEGKPVTCKTLKYQLAFNLYAHDSKIGPNGYNEEEMKMVHETHKIFSCPDIAITCTCVRVPVVRAHSESINLEFTNPISPDEVRAILKTAPGVSIIDDCENNRFPMPIDASGQDDVYVGRIRQDESLPDNRGINLWVSGDQIRKGAALNAIQIAEKLL
jgi:aspartate-semialdehyde dehydrogenase